LNKLHESRSAEDTLALGEKIGRHLKAGDTLLLFGDLGAGKTTLTQGIARGLGVAKEEYVRSPTFTLVNQYQGRYPVYHIDLYRIGSARELEDLGIDEVLAGDGVAIVEWAEKLFSDSATQNPLPEIEQWIEIHIKIEAEDSRNITLKGHNLESSSHPVFTLH
jgi:tRNA threonylcarbamoyladenosine biosynthesis protein TsaE